MRYTFDSREVKPGMGFVALKGEKTDGREFIPMARERGAAHPTVTVEVTDRTSVIYGNEVWMGTVVRAHAVGAIG